MNKTQLVVKLATEERLFVRSRFIDNPPTIILEFPTSRVAGSLPERFVIQSGVIQEVLTAYASRARAVETRWIQALKIRLRGSYRHEVRSEPGRIIVEIEHPAAVASEAVEVGLAGGAIVSGVHPEAFSERFRAMQEALDRVRPQPWVWQASSAPAGTLASTSQAQAPESSFHSSTRDAASATRSTAPQGSPEPTPPPFTRWGWIIGGITLAGAAVGLWRWRSRFSPIRRRLFGGEATARAPAGIHVIDQLVWRAFERQGFQLLHTVECGEPFRFIRIMTKDGMKAALLCVENGTFFDKTTVEQFVKTMRKAQVERGYLIVPGSFTVPAQRCAKEHGVTLMGRDQLMELFSEGAMSEYYTKQLKALYTQLDEAKETLRQYAQQLDVIRRQRNEASWFLGEERAKAAKLEEQLESLSQQVRHWQAQAEQWQQTAEITRKQWEESQWYLGEAKASVRHLEEQLRTLHEAFGQLEAQHREVTETLQEIERQRDEANWYLGESRVRIQALEAELTAVTASRERRRAARVSRPDISIELQRTDGTVLFQGIPRDVSRVGVGLEVDHALDLPAPSDARQAGLPELLQIRLSFPGLERPIEARGRLVWKREDPETHRYQGGLELIDLPADSREAFERSIASSN